MQLNEERSVRSLGLIPQQSIDAVINASDIVEVVSRYVRLEKKSSLNLFGLCPFHDEKRRRSVCLPASRFFIVSDAIKAAM